MNKPLVSVIIVNYNGRKYLQPCFDSLLGGEYRNIEIIFVDNGSSDGSLGFVAENYPQIRIIDNQQNLGLAIASNRGAQAAKGEYLFFLNNDIIADPRLIAELAAAAAKFPNAAAFACKNMTYDGSHEVSLGLSCDIFGFPYENAGPIFYADAGIFVRRGAFVEINGFDELMFLYGEDRDLCWRLFLRGWDIMGVPEAVFYHDSFCTRVSSSKYTSTIMKRYLGEYNLLRSMLKNYSPGVLAAILPLYLALSFIEMMFFLFKGQSKVVFSGYLKAYRKNIIDLPDTMRQRSVVQAGRKVGDARILKKMVKGSGKLNIYRKVGMPRFI
ncbi:MAG: glycosyltransferase family 2 protein [Candidatus Omnitrophota bacterium]|nr:glycosyltransferase family 2 protein [Candidatus Omnitrophota bacterium]